MSTYCLSLPSAGLPDDALQEKSLLGVLGLLSGAPGGCGARKEYAQARLRMESSNFGAPTHEKKKSPQIRGAKKIRVAAKKIKHETPKREGETPKKTSGAENAQNAVKNTTKQPGQKRAPIFSTVYAY